MWIRAREQLRSAYEDFEDLGAVRWAELAELLAPVPPHDGPGANQVDGAAPVA
jgi:hypothetical protein